MYTRTPLHIHTYTPTHTYIHTYIHTHIHLHPHTHLHTHTHTYIHIHTYIHTHKCITSIYIHIGTYIRTHMPHTRIGLRTYNPPPPPLLLFRTIGWFPAGALSLWMEWCIKTIIPPPTHPDHPPTHPLQPFIREPLHDNCFCTIRPVQLLPCSGACVAAALCLDYTQTQARQANLHII